MSRITNTNRDSFGMGGWGNAPGWSGTDAFTGHIEAQEARGQQELVASTDLPSDTRGTDEAFIALGFSFGEPHAHDPLFRPTTLPQGWTKTGTDHSMHSVIRDEQGRDRVGVFYKAAFYDRRADMTLFAPTHRLTELIWGNGEPTALPIDELLSVEAARERLENERAQQVEAESYGLNRADLIARIDSLLALLPPAS